MILQSPQPGIESIFPDKLVVAEVGEYVVTVFGADELVDTFMTHLNGIYGVSATYDEDIL